VRSRVKEDGVVVMIGVAVVQAWVPARELTLAMVMRAEVADRQVRYYLRSGTWLGRLWSQAEGGGLVAGRNLLRKAKLGSRGC